MSSVNPSYLYILSEDDNDDLFYEMCASRISSKDFHLVEPRRIRKGGGISFVRKALNIFLSDLKSMNNLDTYFIIALDNDRAPDHQNSHKQHPKLANRDSNKSCRYCEINNAIERIWGSNQSSWPAQGAIAVPVEMLESWVLLAIDPTRGTLPIFPTKRCNAAISYCGSNPPDQLKDLFNQEVQQLEKSKEDLILDAASNMDIHAVANVSPSFNEFRSQVSLW